MDAAIHLAARNGIVLDICVFTQWVRELGFERAGQPVRFAVRAPADFNVYGMSFRNLALQREYLTTLARRWRGAGNVVYNLANETYVKDPDAGQMDPEAQSWRGIPKEKGVLRDSMLFRRWAREMSQAIRAAGGKQPVISGYMFSAAGGGDDYLANRDGAVQPWHNYGDARSTAATLSYVDPACSNRPVLLEEFGTTGWNREDVYNAAAHAALAAGAAGAMSYEWGVRWLMRQMTFQPLPLRDILRGTPDPRWFGAIRDVVKPWSNRSAGMYPAPSGFYYGSIYSGTPFPAAAAVALGRLGLMGASLGRTAPTQRVYVVVPAAFRGERTGMDPVSRMFRRLWSLHVPFAVAEEDCLSDLPRNAKVLIAPKGASDQSAGKLDALRRSGVRIFLGAGAEWEKAPELEPIDVSPSEGIDLLARDTRDGTLFSLLADAQASPSAYDCLAEYWPGSVSSILL